MTNFSTPVKVVFASFFLSLALWASSFHGKLPAITDVFLYTYPSQSVNQTEWAKGMIPLWDASTGCGTPQLANSLSACFYPPFWLWNVTGLSHWLVWMSLLHVGFAFLGFFLWARSLKIFPLWAALGALSFAGSLHMVRCWGYPVFSAAQAWTPWIFFTASRFLEGGRFRWWMGLILSVGFQVLAGYPFFSFYSVLFLIGWTFFQPISLKRKAQLGGGLLAALAGTALHWLPFLSFLGTATRDHWGSAETFPYFSKAAEYLTLLSPNFLGKPETTAYLGQTANANFMMYFGLIPLAGWLGTILLTKFPGRNFWFSSALFWLVWLMGNRFFLFKIFPESFLEALNPSKAVGIFIFAACTCAGLALTRFFRDRWDEKQRLAVCWILGLLWMLDVFLIPWRTVHLVPDPFLKPEIQQWASRVQAASGGGRLLSLQSRDRDVASDAESRVYEAASDKWVRGLLANSQQVWGIRSVQAYLSLWTRSMEKLWRAFNKKETFDGTLADVAGLRLLFFPIELPAPHYRTLEKIGDNYLIENQYCRGDAWAVPEGKVFASQDEILGQLLRAPSAQKNENAVWLEDGKFLLPPARRLEYLPAGDPEGFERLSGTRARFKGHLSGEKWLVLNDTFSPGWKAWVDGEPAPIHRAFGFFMAVPLGPSVNRVDFRYEPASFRLGLFISLLSLGMGLGAFRLNFFSNSKSSEDSFSPEKAL